MSGTLDGLRDGEIPFPDEPSTTDDAALQFIGLVHSPWIERSQCPKNVREARERRIPASLELRARYRDALDGLVADEWIVVLTWLHQARRDLARQRPRHAARPHGTFSLRSPVRPNPIGLHLVRIVSLDHRRGRIGIDAIDVLDGTPLLDIKPYLPGVDAPPPADPVSDGD